MEQKYIGKNLREREQIEIKKEALRRDRESKGGEAVPPYIQQ